MSNNTESEFNKIRAAFMQRASAPNITPFALKLAYIIAFKYMNRQSGTARPAQETLASDLNVTSRTIRTLLDILEPLGLTIIPGHGPNRASTYCIDPTKATPVSPIKPGKRKLASAYNRKPASTYEPNTGNLVHDNRKPDDSNTGSQLPPNLTKRTKKKNQGVERLSRASRSMSETSPDFASRDSSKQDSADEGSDLFPTAQTTTTERAPKKKKAAGASAAIAEAFERFFAIFPNKSGKEPARKAFAKAVENGTDAEIIIAGGQRYAVAEQMRLARPGQSPQHTAMAKNWLPDQRWNDPAPPGAVVDNDTGAVVAIEEPEREERRGVDEIYAEMVATVAAAAGPDSWWAGGKS